MIIVSWLFFFPANGGCYRNGIEGWNHSSWQIRTCYLVQQIPLLLMVWWSKKIGHVNSQDTWWRHQMETLSALLAICAGNSPVPGDFPTQRPVTRSFDVFFDLRLHKRLNKQSPGWWFLRRYPAHYDVTLMIPEYSGLTTRRDWWPNTLSYFISTHGFVLT